MTSSDAFLIGKRGFHAASSVPASSVIAARVPERQIQASNNCFYVTRFQKRKRRPRLLQAFRSRKKIAQVTAQSRPWSLELFDTKLSLFSACQHVYKSALDWSFVCDLALIPRRAGLNACRGFYPKSQTSPKGLWVSSEHAHESASVCQIILLIRLIVVIALCKAHCQRR